MSGLQEVNMKRVISVRNRRVLWGPVMAVCFLVVPLPAFVTTLLAQSQSGMPAYTVLYAFTGGEESDGIWIKPNAPTPEEVTSMRRRKYLATVCAVLIGVIASVALAATCPFPSYILYAWKSGGEPIGTLTWDAAGNLYGTTFQGGGSGCGGSGCGAVWELKHNASGTWTMSRLHVFTGADGANPTAGVIFDEAGNLYGTTWDGGGTGCSEFNQGCGVVFKLAPNPDGTWTESVLYRFTGGADGANPSGGVIFDAAGNLYGTTTFGAGSGCGTGYCGLVFELKPNPDGSWTESVLTNLGSNGLDTGNPRAGLIFDASGNLYGTTSYGGGCNGEEGSVFKLAPNPDGTWTESVLQCFTGGPEGGEPVGGVIFDAAGNLYGTTPYGGGSTRCGTYYVTPSLGPSPGCGTVFKLAPNPDGTWTESVLHSFTGGADGAVPAAGLTLGPAGNFYGTTMYGGAPSVCGGKGCGVVFKLAPNPDGTWTETVLHDFTDTPGAYPFGGVVLDKADHLYGTAQGDFTKTFGDVFEIRNRDLIKSSR